MVIVVITVVIITSTNTRNQWLHVIKTHLTANVHRTRVGQQYFPLSRILNTFIYSARFSDLLFPFRSCSPLTADCQIDSLLLPRSQHGHGFDSQAGEDYTIWGGAAFVHSARTFVGSSAVVQPLCSNNANSNGRCQHYST